jgi:hypothetical protein
VHGNLHLRRHYHLPKKVGGSALAQLLALAPVEPQRRVAAQARLVLPPATSLSAGDRRRSRIERQLLISMGS